MRWLGVLVGLAIAMPTAHADKTEEAKAHFKTGADLYDANNFRGALVEFQKAYELAPSYRILFNIGQVEMELQDYAGALKAYSRYLREGGPDIAADRAQLVREDVERLKGRVGQMTIQTAAGAEVLVDDVSIGYAPLPEPVAVNTGRHRVEIHVKNHPPESRFVDVAGQEQLTVAIAVDLALPATSAAAQVDVPKPLPAGPPSKTPMYVAWGATGAFAIAGGVFAFRAHTQSKDLEKMRNTFPVTKDQLDAQSKKVKTSSLLADGFGAAAVVAGGIGLYLTLGRSYASPTAEKTVELHVGANGAFVTGQF